MNAKPLMAGVISAAFLAASVWGAAMLVHSGLTSVAPTPAVVSIPVGAPAAP